MCGGNVVGIRKTADSMVYPRVCGGNRPPGVRLQRLDHLSPRVRGKPGYLAGSAAKQGSIPACAGETACPVLETEAPRVYPRVCGGNNMSCTHHLPPEGLSPRVRGKHPVTCSSAAAGGSIPACAGETWWPNTAALSTMVYPRVCGGNSLGSRSHQSIQGLSPRVRGKRRNPQFQSIARRSIPACAGETPQARLPCRGYPVYPRVCGGNGTTLDSTTTRDGLSPRVRGKPIILTPEFFLNRSIPACAGETSWGSCGGNAGAVYPRVCGGNRSSQVLTRLFVGLSPRVRGKHPSGIPPRTRRGSIPACAGETGGKTGFLEAI